MKRAIALCLRWDDLFAELVLRYRCYKLRLPVPDRQALLHAGLFTMTRSDDDTLKLALRDAARSPVQSLLSSLWAAFLWGMR